MFKYLAGIFAKPDNYYVDGRLATPLTPISPRKKWLAGGSLSPKRPRIGSHFPVIQSSTRKPKVQPVLEPVSYIVNVSESCSSNDENESIVSLPTTKLPRAIRSDSNINALLEYRLNECWSSCLEIQIPGPPPVSPDQSCMSLNAVIAHDDGATNWDQLPYASDKDLFCDCIPQESKSMANDWELGWLPEEFWLTDTDAVIVTN